MLRKLKIGKRCSGSPSGMFVPKESAIAIIMEAWEVQGRYHTVDKDLKKFYVEPLAQDDRPRSILTHPQPPQAQVPGSTAGQDPTDDTIPTGSDANQSAPTPNTQNPHVRDVRTLAYREGASIPEEEATWKVMAAVYRHTIGEFLKQGIISVAPLIEDENREDFQAILKVRNVAQWGEFLVVDKSIRDRIIRDFFIISRLKLFGNQDLTGRDQALGELFVRMMPEFLMSFIETYSKSTTNMYLLEILITRYQGFVVPHAKILSDFPTPKPASPPPNLRVASGTPTVPTPNVSIAEDVICPSVEPPKGLMHCTGYYQINGTSIIWVERIPLLRLEQLPSNITYIESHWTERTLPDGSMVVGKDESGQWRVVQPGHPEFPGDTVQPRRYTPVIQTSEPPITRVSSRVTTPTVHFNPNVAQGIQGAKAHVSNTSRGYVHYPIPNTPSRRLSTQLADTAIPIPQWSQTAARPTQP
jgi:hypothetical protein